MLNRLASPSPTWAHPGRPAFSCHRAPDRQNRPALNHRLKRLLAAAITLWFILLVAPLGYAGAAPAADVGQAIYLHGVRGDGQPLRAQRMDGMRIEGADAACVNCHQRSGLGAKEGNKSIPPITARYLFHPRASQREDLALPYVEGIRADREPYTDATIARAVRDGLGSEGKPLDYLMPHFELDDADMDALIAYLKHLDQRKVPGVTDTVLHFATIITPDADPVKRAGMLAVLEKFFTSKNAYSRAPAPRLASTRTMMFKTNRRWQLHVWQLDGPADTWQSQLKRHLAKEPVLAVISGLGGRNWAPVHAFCEQAALPCLFPNVEAPPANADRDFYSLYFSKGVLLEAGLIAHNILNPGSGKLAQKVHQVYRAGDSGESGALALASTLRRAGIAVENHVLPAGAAGRGMGPAIRQARHADALVLWLRQRDLTALDGLPVPQAAVFMSGLLGGLEGAPLPPGWRERTRMAYPFGLPQQRLINLDFAQGWFRIRQIPVVDLRVQSDTYLACGLLSETLNRMADTFTRDYLVERVQGMLEHRIITGYYPRLSLAAGQRFASKGGYLVHFPEGQGVPVATDQNWLVP
jgi:hypothetical protein